MSALLTIRRLDVDKCNDRLRQELGVSYTGLPLFLWGHSEDPYFFHPQRHIEMDGSLVFEYECLCGTNIHPQEHKPECRGSLAVPSYEIVNLLRRPIYTGPGGAPISNQWVLWYWNKPEDEETWKALFGTKLAFDKYKAGGYEPARAYAGATLCCPEGTLPTLSLTDMCIQAYRKRQADRAMAKSESEMLLESHMESVKRKAVLAEKIKDATLVGIGNAKVLPGTKGGVSFRQSSIRKAKKGLGIVDIYKN